MELDNNLWLETKTIKQSDNMFLPPPSGCFFFHHPGRLVCHVFAVLIGLTHQLLAPTLEITCWGPKMLWFDAANFQQPGVGNAG